jgi:hypothetical protein
MLLEVFFRTWTFGAWDLSYEAALALPYALTRWSGAASICTR